eukprot:2073615-Amphidinium_carterae.2
MISGDLEAVLPPTGVPQGHNLSALLFDFFYSDLMRDLDALLVNEGLCLQLPLPDGCIPVVSSSSGLCDIGSAAYRDDLVVPVVADSGKKASHTAEQSCQGGRAKILKMQCF